MDTVYSFFAYLTSPRSATPARFYRAFQAADFQSLAGKTEACS